MINLTKKLLELRTEGHDIYIEHRTSVTGVTINAINFIEFGCDAPIKILNQINGQTFIKTNPLADRVAELKVELERAEKALSEHILGN